MTIRTITDTARMVGQRVPWQIVRDACASQLIAIVQTIQSISAAQADDAATRNIDAVTARNIAGIAAAALTFVNRCIDVDVDVTTGDVLHIAETLSHQNITWDALIRDIPRIIRNAAEMGLS